MHDVGVYIVRAVSQCPSITSWHCIETHCQAINSARALVLSHQHEELDEIHLQTHIGQQNLVIFYQYLSTSLKQQLLWNATCL